jgi:2-polyprenyl-3-methyl-5-hydroxy-6-metoxy-1,4-benzoquinol methylase
LLKPTRDDYDHNASNHCHVGASAFDVKNAYASRLWSANNGTLLIELPIITSVTPQLLRGTLSASISDLYREFLPLVPTGGKILDAGCGSGRDSVYFKQQGFSVTAFDASSEAAQIASRAIGQPVNVMTFIDVKSIVARPAETDGGGAL